MSASHGASGVPWALAVDRTASKSLVGNGFPSGVASKMRPLATLLSAQPNITGEHDEQLFFILHQVKELWMKLMLHELGAVYPYIRDDNLRPAFKIFARVKRIQENLINAWHILTTMTPADYLAFRDALGQSSSATRTGR